MRAKLIVLTFVAVAACGQPQPAPLNTPQEPAASSVESGDVAGGDTIEGPFTATSTTAMGITGDASFSNGQVSFMNGILVRTTHIATYSAGNLNIELRRVTEQVVPDGVIGLCGTERPRYVALAYDERATVVTLLVFAGDEPPGPEATISRVCARFGYAAPDGARTREGVVL